MTSREPYEVGTQVRVIKYPSTIPGDPQAGDLGTVTTDQGGLYVDVDMNPKPDHVWPINPNYLFLESEIEMAYTFKVGDKLTVLAHKPLYANVVPGDVVTVAEFPYELAYGPPSENDEDYPFPLVLVEKENGAEYYVGVTHVAKYDESPVTPEPRLVTYEGKVYEVRDPDECTWPTAGGCAVLYNVDAPKDGSVWGDRFHAPLVDVEDVTAEPTPVESYDVIPHGDWVLYEGKPYQVFRVEDWDSVPGEGANNSTPLIGYYGTHEKDSAEERPFRRFAYRSDVTHLVAEYKTPNPEPSSEPTPEPAPVFKVGDRVEVVKDDPYLRTGEFVGKVGTVRYVNEGASMPYDVQFDGGQGVPQDSWYVTEVKTAPPIFEVGKRYVKTVGPSTLEYEVITVDTESGYVAAWMEYNGETEHNGATTLPTNQRNKFTEI